jgi:hypothetical protein
MHAVQGEVLGCRVLGEARPASERGNDHHSTGRGAPRVRTWRLVLRLRVTTTAGPWSPGLAAYFIAVGGNNK